MTIRKGEKNTGNTSCIQGHTIGMLYVQLHVCAGEDDSQGLMDVMMGQPEWQAGNLCGFFYMCVNA